jgi:hypothetical protein
MTVFLCSARRMNRGTGATASERLIKLIRFYRGAFSRRWPGQLNR